METCPTCDYTYMYEIKYERVTWSGKFKRLCLKCMFCGRVEYKTERLKKPVKSTYPSKEWNKITSQ